MRNDRPEPKQPHLPPLSDPNRPSPPAPLESAQGDLLRQRAAKLQRELGQVLFALLERKRANGVTRHVPDRFPLALALELFNGKEVEAAPDQLYDGLLESVEKWAARSAAFPVGHVYCHWTQSFTGPASVPPGTREVFAGYSSTGEPIWREFAAVLLERRDPRIERVFRPGSTPVTVLQTGNELTRNQLSVYGKHSPVYRILAQLTAGYLPLERRGGVDGGVAISFQAVELAGGSRIELNILGRLGDGRPAFQVLEETADQRLANALLATRRNLAELAIRKFSRRRRGVERRRLSLGILQRFGKQLERVYRQRKRRTQHAQKRHLDRRRPASSALGDALQASSTSFFRDVQERTWIVVGPKNRVHVFNDEARHVTSVVYGGETIKQRTTRGKWREPDAEDLRAFRARLRARHEEQE